MNARYMFYLHRRLMVQKYGRQEMFDILARKTLKSVARSTAGRLSSNKWLRALEFMFRSCGVANHTEFSGQVEPPALQQFVSSFTLAINKYASTHKVSAARTLLIVDYLRYKYQTNAGFVQQLNAEREKFLAREDSCFFDDFVRTIGLNRAGCGHITNETVYVSGTEEDVDHMSTVCPDCRQAVVSSGERVPVGDGTLILAAYAVRVFGQDNRMYIADQRRSGIRFIADRNIWVDRYWQQYGNIIEGYHTSRSRGWKVIESDWFRRHRRAYGLELEVQNRSGENSNNMAGRVHEVLNPSGDLGEYCYFERDGSIGEGFELITQPAGLDTHRSKLDLFLNNEELKRGLRSHEGGNCGLHIHVGRQYLTQAQIYRIQSFLNDVRNEGLIRKISRRYGNSYARFRPEMGKLSPIGKNNGERYEALNVTNRETVEFRIFRGSLRYESVIAALEFVDALLTFCMPGQTSIMDFNAIGFRRFISDPSMSVDTKYLRPYLSINSSTDNEQSIRLAA